MKGLKLLLLSFCVAFAACSVQSPSVQVSDKGTKWSWDKGTIVVETPERPAGQTSVIGLTAPKIEAVRVGFVGLGMRGPSAVERLLIFQAWRLWLFAITNRNVPRSASAF